MPVTDCGLPENETGCNPPVLTSTHCGSEAVYEPESGFTVMGDDTIVCLESGEWRGAEGYTICDGKCALLAMTSSDSCYHLLPAI